MSNDTGLVIIELVCMEESGEMMNKWPIKCLVHFLYHGFEKQITQKVQFLPLPIFCGTLGEPLFFYTRVSLYSFFGQRPNLCMWPVLCAACDVCREDGTGNGPRSKILF